MTDKLFEAYQRSVRNTLRNELAVSMMRVPLWVVEALGNIYRHVPTKVPYSVLALTNVSWEREPRDLDVEKIRAQLLLHNGWDIETSALLYKNFRVAFPQWPVNPEMWRVYSRQQLREELGPTYGDIVADLCSDPTCNPIFGAMMLGDLGQPVQRRFAQQVMSFNVSRRVLVNGRLPERARIDLYGCTTDDIRADAIAVDERQADDLYHRTTGKHLIDPDIDPRTYDYDRAALRAALRQADCAFDPFGAEPHEGDVPV